MRTLIIPDLHHHLAHAEYWLRTQPHDRVVFLGDFFDDFGDDAEVARVTAEWVRTQIEATDAVLLFGNHDIPYLAPQLDQLYCPGFTHEKAEAIGRVLTPQHWRRFKVAHLEQGWLLSHAGFHPSWSDPPLVQYFLTGAEKALKRLAAGTVEPLLGAGWDRGGRQPMGGPLWMDWETFEPIPGVNQIVGHTPGRAPRQKCTAQSENHCLDVGQALVAGMLENGRLTVLQR